MAADVIGRGTDTEPVETKKSTSEEVCSDSPDKQSGEPVFVISQKAMTDFINRIATTLTWVQADPLIKFLNSNLRVL